MRSIEQPRGINNRSGTSSGVSKKSSKNSMLNSSSGTASKSSMQTPSSDDISKPSTPNNSTGAASKQNLHNYSSGGASSTSSTFGFLDFTPSTTKNGNFVSLDHEDDPALQGNFKLKLKNYEFKEKKMTRSE